MSPGVSHTIAPFPPVFSSEHLQLKWQGLGGSLGPWLASYRRASVLEVRLDRSRGWIAAESAQVVGAGAEHVGQPWPLKSPLPATPLAGPHEECVFCMGVLLVAEGLQEDPACHRRCQVTLLAHRIRFREVFLAGDCLLGFCESEGGFLHLGSQHWQVWDGTRWAWGPCGEDTVLRQPASSHGVMWHHSDTLEMEDGMTKELN